VERDFDHDKTEWTNQEILDSLLSDVVRDIHERAPGYAEAVMQLAQAGDLESLRGLMSSIRAGAILFWCGRLGMADG
jgi:hypothetical protein